VGNCSWCISVTVVRARGGLRIDLPRIALIDHLTRPTALSRATSHFRSFRGLLSKASLAMDIRQMINSPDPPDIRPSSSSLSSPDFAGSESSRSQVPVKATRKFIYIAPHPSESRHRDEICPTYHYRGPVERKSVERTKRKRERRSPIHLSPPAKRRITAISGDNGKAVPARRWVSISACDACRTKKSKCDKERPSCESCIESETECIDGKAPVVPLYGPCLQLQLIYV